LGEYGGGPGTQIEPGAVLAPPLFCEGVSEGQESPKGGQSPDKLNFVPICQKYSFGARPLTGEAVPPLEPPWIGPRPTARTIITMRCTCYPC